MAEAEEHHAQDRKGNLHAAVRKGQGTGHGANADCANSCGQEKPVIAKTLTQRQYSKNDGKEKSDFMNDGVQEKPTSRCENCQQNGGYKAMQQAQPGNAQTEPVPSPFLPRMHHTNGPTLIR